MENLKEKIPMIICSVVAIVVLGIAVYFMEFHHSIYYTQIDNRKIEKISASDNMKYEYTLDCYSETGRKKEIKFKTSRELRNNAYLKLDVMITGVHNWQEVLYHELPDKVKVNYSE